MLRALYVADRSLPRTGAEELAAGSDRQSQCAPLSRRVLTHESRQVPSWLIFDVRRIDMKPVTLIAAFVSAITLLAACQSLPATSLRRRPMTPMEAVEKSAARAEGVTGVFELVVRATGTDRGQIFLNSQEDYRDRRNVSLQPPGAPRRGSTLTLVIETSRRVRSVGARC